MSIRITFIFASYTRMLLEALCFRKFFILFYLNGDKIIFFYSIFEFILVCIGMFVKYICNHDFCSSFYVILFWTQYYQPTVYTYRKKKKSPKAFSTKMWWCIQEKTQCTENVKCIFCKYFYSYCHKVFFSIVKKIFIYFVIYHLEFHVYFGFFTLYYFLSLFDIHIYFNFLILFFIFVVIL